MIMEFPALVFSHDSVHLMAAKTNLMRATRLALRTGYFENLKLADRSGNLARVVHVKRIRILPPRSFDDFMGWLEANPKYEIFLEFKQLPSISLSEIKQLIFRCFENDSELWEEMIDLRDFEQDIEAAKTFDQLFEAFQKFHV